MEDGLLRVDSVIEPKFRHLFIGHESFNHMQSAILKQALQSDNSMVVAAPTGSGKTVIHELAVVRLLSCKASKPCKIVYVAPNKALCQQRMREWEIKFAPLGQTVLEVTGDIDFKQCLRMIARATIIVTTPEKWDSLTRTWKDHVFLLGAIDLLLVDEVHHLSEERGATLEALVVRMRMLNRVYCERIKTATENLPTSMRIIALSATLPNLADIGEWLGCRHEAIHYFDETFRPVPLTVYTLPMRSMHNPFLFDKSLDERVAPLIVRYGEGRQVLVFCASKKNTEHLAAILAQRLHVHPRIAAAIRYHATQINSTRDLQLRELLHRGMAYHHAGLPPDDRALVEQLYLAGAVYVLCSTSTLAHGVNLPAHLVVVKGTTSWRGGSRGYERTPKADIIQMLGRAGRPGLDEAGVAVIMTSREDEGFYSNVSLSAEVVESRLQCNLVETICAEVTQGVITSVAECVQWVRSTFFYIRVRKNPTKYGFGELRDTAELDALLTSICSAAVGDLARAGLIQFDQSTQRVVANHEANVMTHNLIRFATMDRLVNLPALTGLAELLTELSRSQELNKPVRRLEKTFLNDLMRGMRFPLKQRVQEPWLKSYVLLQAAIARTELKDFSLKVEQAEIVECGLRVLAAVRELAAHRELGKLLESAILLDRALRLRMWESNYGSIFLQCPGLSVATMNALVLRGVRTIGDALGCTPNRLQEMAGCSLAEASAMLSMAKLLHQASRTVHISLQQGVLQITVYKVAENDQSAAYSSVGDAECPFPSYQLVVYDVLTGKALCVRALPRGTTLAEFSVPCPPEVTVARVQCSLLSSHVGIDFYQHATANPSQVAGSTTPAVTASSAAKATPKTAPKKPAAPRTVVDPTPTPTPLMHISSSQHRAPHPAVQRTTSTGPSLDAYYALHASPPLEGHGRPTDSVSNPWPPDEPRADSPSPAPVNSAGWLDGFRYRDTAPSSEVTSKRTAARSTLPTTIQGASGGAHAVASGTSKSPDDKGEIAALRRKAEELELHRIPVKRLKKSSYTDENRDPQQLLRPNEESPPVVSPQSPQQIEKYPLDPPERWYRRVAPTRRSFFDDSDEPVIPATFDFTVGDIDCPATLSLLPAYPDPSGNSAGQFRPGRAHHYAAPMEEPLRVTSAGEVPLPRGGPAAKAQDRAIDDFEAAFF